MSQIRDAVAGASAYLSEHPDEARYRDSHARARLSDGLHVEIEGPGGERLATDMPRAIGGAAAAPSPGWYLRAAAASCVASLIGIRAAMVGLELPAESVSVTVDSESDDRGILGLDDAVAAGALSMRIAVSLTAVSVDRSTFEDVARWAVEHCPVTDTIRRAVPIELEVG
jgi:uncharacterized OsmC-like protein